MAEAIQIAGALIKAKQQKNQAVIAQKTADTERLTEGLNSEQRKRDRIKEFRRITAENTARGGASGTDTFSGSGAHATQINAGETKGANFEDVFSTKIRQGQITESGKAKARAAKAKSTGTLLNLGGDLYKQRNK